MIDFSTHVYAYPCEEYKKMVLFLLADLSGGVAIKNKNEIVSVFKSLT